MEDLLKLLGGIVVLAAIAGFWFLVFRKAGYERGNSALMAIGMFIPLVNVGIAIYFVSTTWPTESLLSALRGQAGVGTEDDAVGALSVATRLEARGEVGAAIAKYEEVVRRFGGTEAAKDAEVSIRSLKSKIDET
jgi:hypothetical protein